MAKSLMEGGGGAKPPRPAPACAAFAVAAVAGAAPAAGGVAGAAAEFAAPRRPPRPAAGAPGTVGTGVPHGISGLPFSTVRSGLKDFQEWPVSRETSRHCKSI